MWRSCLFAQVVGGCCHSNSYLTEYYLECQLADYSLISRRDYSTNSNFRRAWSSAPSILSTAAANKSKLEGRLGLFQVPVHLLFVFSRIRFEFGIKDRMIGVMSPFCWWSYYYLTPFPPYYDNFQEKRHHRNRNQ